MTKTGPISMIDDDVDGSSEACQLEMLRSIVVHLPETMKLVETDEFVTEVLPDEDEMREETQRLLKMKRRWHEILLQQCFNRIVDISMIFVELPALIIVEICLLDRQCLRVIDERLLWDVVKKVKKIKFY